MYTYDPLWKILKSKNSSTYQLIQKHKIDPQTIERLKHNQNITVETLDKLCKILECRVEDIIFISHEEMYTEV